MSPSWSRLSKTEAIPVKVPESSSVPLISRDGLVLQLSPLSGQRNRRIDKRHWPQPAGSVVRIVRGVLARCSSDLGRWLAALRH